MTATVLKFRSDIAFDPEVTAAMGSAFDLLSYDFTHRGLKVPSELTKQIIDRAREGIIDPHDIRAACLAAHLRRAKAGMNGPGLPVAQCPWHRLLTVSKSLIASNAGRW